MKKRDVNKYPVGSPEYVVAHFKWRESRGKKNPSTRYDWFKNPRQSLKIAKRLVETNKHLKGPMLQCLSRIIEELDTQLHFWNKTVEEKTGKNLGLRITDKQKISKNEWILKVEGITHADNPTEELFKIVWWNHTCPTSFHLFQWGEISLSYTRDFIYSGVIQPHSNFIAKEIAIFTHHLQIPNILSRI